MAETNPTAPGGQTSEGKLTLLAMVLGTVLEAVAGIMHSLQDSGHGAPWFPAVLAVVGVLLQVVSLYGYNRGRATVKTAMIAAEAPAVVPPR